MRNLRLFLSVFILNIFLLINFSPLKAEYMFKGLTVGKCDTIIELYELDNERAEEVLTSAFQSFLTGFNLGNHSGGKGNYKNLDVGKEYIFQTIMQDCRRKKDEKIWKVLVNFWRNDLQWSKK
jgi:hypothetical protein